MSLILVPSIDILDGKVVRARQGDTQAVTKYYDDPLKAAADFLGWGAVAVHVVDLNAAIHRDTIRNERVLKRLLVEFRGTSLRIQIAGGFRNPKRAECFLRMGASRVVLASIAYDDLNSAEAILSSAGASRIVLALDYDQEGFVRSHGWKKKENEFVWESMKKFKSLGFTQFLTTSIAKDGMLEGPDLETLKKLRREFPGQNTRLVASGGASSDGDLSALSEIGIDEVVVGKALYEGTIDKASFSLYSR